MKKLTIKELKAMLYNAEQEAMSEIIALLKESQRPLTASHIAAKCNVSVQLISSTLGNAYRSGCNPEKPKYEELVRVRYSHKLEVRTKEVIRRFAEIDEDGELIGEGNVKVVRSYINTYELKAK